MANNFGASPEAWDVWSALAGDDLLPAVANPDAQISAGSKLAAVGKTPSQYNSQREVIGIAKWTQYMPSPAELKRWAAEPDYAISVQCRGEIKALDVDVGDPVKSKAIRDAITAMLGPCPVRYRDNSGKLLIPIRHAPTMVKRVLPVDGGMIEFLANGQQFIADGYHQSGTRYQWNGTALPEMQTVSAAQLQALFDMLEMCFGTDSWKIARERREGSGGDLAVDDDVAEWLVANWETHGHGPAGQINIECPFASDHTGPSGESSTSYFPAGTGGYAQGHFVCLHAHCAGRDDREFLDATGYSASLFADLSGPPAVIRGAPSGPDGRGLGATPEGGAGDGADGEPERPALALVRDKQGRIEPTADNMVKLCMRPDQIGKILAFDGFKDELVWAPAHQRKGEEQWRSFADVDYVDVRIELERRGVKPMGQDLLRSTIMRAAVERHMDTAQIWLDRLQWDGVERLESFCIAGWGWASSDYSRAVGRYIWTALAGRVLDPGCQADMAPILVGPQGLGKTSVIKAMAPADEHYVSIPLDDHDNDTSRRLRGKLVGELEELRGLNSKAIEVIKAWITRTTEGWIPKYKEFESTFKRRLVFFGSTNDDEFLNDPTGERRWLPGRCGDLNVDWVKEHRDQLWAEGAARFRLTGVDWEDAQRLAQDEHHDFKVSDSWESAVERWLVEPQINGTAPAQEEYVLMTDVLAGAANIPVSHQDRAKEMRMAKVLKGLGYSRARVSVGDHRIWVYRRD